MTLAALADVRTALEASVGPLVPVAGLPEVVELAGRTGAAVCYLVVTEVGGVALVVAPGEVPHAIWLDQLTDQAVAGWSERITALSDRLSRSGRTATMVAEPVGSAPPHEHPGDEHPDEEAWKVLSELKAALAALPEGPLRLVPTGALARLPVAAALSATAAPRPVSVGVSARLHHVALDHAGRRNGDAVGVVAAPSPCTLPTSEQARHLPGALKEATWLAARYGTEPRVGEHATKAALEGLLDERLRILHLGVHGTVDALHPENSAALMKDGPDELAERLVLSEVRARKLFARLVFLAACWLGRPAESLPDEAIGFPTLLCEAGAGADRPAVAGRRRGHLLLRHPLLRAPGQGG